MKTLLVFAEDPGAANGLMDLPKKNKTLGWNILLFATGAACEYMQKRNIQFSKIELTRKAEEFLRELKPHAVLVGTATNSDTYGLQIIVAAQKLGIPSIGYVDAITNSQYRFSGKTKDPLAFKPNNILVTEQSCYQAFLELGVPQTDLSLIENPYYERVYQAKEKFSKLDILEVREKLFGKTAASRLIICFLSEISEGVDRTYFKLSEEYQFRGRGIQVDRTKIILEEILDCLEKKSLEHWFVLRLHPKNQITEFKEYSNEIHQMDKNSDPLELVFFSDIIIGMNTSLMVEAKLMGKTVFSVVPREIERKWMPEIFNDQDIATDPSMLTKILDEKLNESKIAIKIEPLISKKPSMVDNLEKILKEIK